MGLGCALGHTLPASPAHPSCWRRSCSDRNGTSMRSRQSSAPAPAPGKLPTPGALGLSLFSQAENGAKAELGLEAAPQGQGTHTGHCTPQKPRRGGTGDPQSHQCQLRLASRRAHLHVGAIYILDGSANALWQRNLNMVIKYETPHSCLQFKLSHLNQV